MRASRQRLPSDVAEVTPLLPCEHSLGEGFFAKGVLYGDAMLDQLSEVAQRMGRDEWRVVSDVAQVVANYLRCHPRVEAVLYPGLKDDALFKDASTRLVGGFGPIVYVLLEGEWHVLVCERQDAVNLVMMLEHSLSKRGHST